MRKLKNWTAKRAGGRITIDGVDAETGKPVKVAGVDTIDPSSTNPIAAHKDGEHFELLPLDGNLRDRIKAILDVGTGDVDRDAALAGSKLADIRRLVG
jgi:hypothetical protein